MPEGDTVWQTAKRLRRLDGQTLTRTDFRIPSLATVDLSGTAAITTVSRGKHLLTRLGGGWTLHSHLKMEGHWAVHDLGHRWRKPAHTARVVLQTAQLEAVGFQVLMDLLTTDREHEYVGHLGPDLLGDDWDAEEALHRIRALPDVPIGDALLDQRNLAGIGNVYKCELCFLTGVDPHTPVRAVPGLDRLVHRAHQLLRVNKERIDRVTTGRLRHGEQTWVYRRRGPCLRCGTRIEYDQLGPPGQERGTWWCPACQPPG